MPRTHIVEQGESVSLVAKQYGIDWRKVYEDPSNAEFKQRRPNPNLILPGDEIVIPDIPPTAFSCATGRAHKFRIPEMQPDELILVLKQSDGTPFASEDCEVYFLKNATDRDNARGGEKADPLMTSASNKGELRVPVKEGATHAQVWMVKKGLSFLLAIGCLDPIRDKNVPFHFRHCKITGVQARLRNLGYSCGEIDGIIGPRTKAAIRRFQRNVMRREQPDGVLDEETCSRLESEHGC